MTGFDPQTPLLLEAPACSTNVATNTAPRFCLKHCSCFFNLNIDYV